jgi:HEAT repeat protein
MGSRPEGGIERLLKDRDWRVRRRAALELGYAAGPRSYGTLIPLLDDHDPAVRQAAILSLGRLGVSDVVEELIKPKVLADEDAEVRRAVVSVLGRLGGLPIVDAVSEALTDPDWTVRSEAIGAVSGLVDRFSEFRIPEAAKFLVRMLPIGDRDVREKTIRALGGFGRAAVHTLLEALEVKSELVRSGAAAALGLVRDPTTVQRLVELLDDPSRQVRLAAITALGNMRPARAIPPLIERLGDADAAVRAAAIGALERIGPASVVPLIEALGHASTETSAAEILRALGEFRDDRALVPIMNHLGHTYMRVRVAAVDAAVAYGEDAVPYLVDMMVLNAVPIDDLLRDARRNRQKRNRLRTIRALGELKDSRAVSLLKEVGQEDDAEIRQAVEEALAKIGSATWARASAAKALGLIGGETAVLLLVRQLDDPNSTVRLRVVRALARIGDGRAARPLARLLAEEEDAEVREEIAGGFGVAGLVGPDVVSASIRALGDDSRSVRSRAARALGRLASPRAALPLVGALGDGYWSVRRDAENSIMNLGPRAVPPLIDALDSRKPVVRLRASRILGAIGDRRARSPLRKLLARERNEEVLESARAALAAVEET